MTIIVGAGVGVVVVTIIELSGQISELLLQLIDRLLQLSGACAEPLQKKVKIRSELSITYHLLGGATPSL